MQKRVPRKITPKTLLEVLCQQAISKAPSYNDLAISMCNYIGSFASKQAFWKKINSKECVSFIKSALGKVIEGKTATTISVQPYKRIIVQDSTIIQLPQNLFETFSGANNQHKQVCNARIQTVYDLLSSEFISFSIDPYSKNDAKAAPELVLEKGDLVLRDRGYSSYQEIRRHKANQANLILRHKHKATYLDPVSCEPINLIQLLKEKQKLDITVLLNDDQKTPIRLIASPVDEETANIRRMKAKKGSHRNKLGKEYLESLSWTIFITTLPKDTADFEDIFKLYQLRWRIESIFKTWKSYLNFTKIHKVSENQLKCIIMARFIMIVITSSKIYSSVFKEIKEKFNKQLSLIKLIRYFQVNNNVLQTYKCIKRKKEGYSDLLEALSRYCSYEKRKKRKNFCEKFDNIFA